jgi:hypothetical protein
VNINIFRKENGVAALAAADVLSLNGLVGGIISSML